MALFLSFLIRRIISVMQTILYGNGVNRLTKGMPSWDQLIEEIADVKLDDRIPNPLKYEALLLDKPYRGPYQRLETKDGESLMTAEGKRLYVEGERTEKELKEKIATRLKSFGTNRVYGVISKLPVSHLITTNYDYPIFKNIGTGDLDSSYPIEKVYSIRRNYVIKTSDGGVKRYWPMHGSIDSPASIMLGFDHYCGSLAKIEQYVKGGYDMHGKRVESMTKRLNEGIKEILSWIDLFFISDVHIIGLNLGDEETDLWWVLNKRRRIKQAASVPIENRIFYYPVEKVKKGIGQLLKSFDVEVVTLERSKLKRPFNERYMKQLAIMGHNMHNNRDV